MKQVATNPRMLSVRWPTVRQMLERNGEKETDPAPKILSPHEATLRDSVVIESEKVMNTTKLLHRER